MIVMISIRIIYGNNINNLLAQKDEILESDNLRVVEGYKKDLTKFYDLIKMLGKPLTASSQKKNGGE